MTRALQDRLALANIKMSRGWQHRSLESIEPEIELELKRKRSISRADLHSDASSTPSGRCFSTGLPASSPLTAPMLSDNIVRSGSSQASAKRRKIKAPPPRRTASTSHLSKSRTASFPTAHSWNDNAQLSHTSPIVQHQTKASRSSVHIPSSFASETSTVLDSSSVSEDDDQDIPLHSFQFPDSQISSSPPRTPPPDLARSARLRTKSFGSQTPGQENHPGKEGADLLMFFASSPLPGNNNQGKTPMQPPSTPPAKGTPLPSSMMSTPGGHNLLFPNTPGNPFNFADYLNVTPSPAQGPWNKTPKTPKTPGLLKTPNATRETRRRLNFASPNLSSAPRSSSRGKEGLGMELGGELRS